MAQNDNLQTLQPSEPSAEHTRLEVFIGKWKAEGVNKEGSPVAGARMRTVENYEWLPGGFFLDHRSEMWNGDIEESIKTLEVLGYDASRHTYSMSMFDSQGNAPTYQASVQDNTWTLTGKLQRATLVFSADGNAFTSNWDVSSDGVNWLPLCEITATKVK